MISQLSQHDLYSRGHLDTGRVALMSTRNITRGKLQTSDNNYIDTLFVDNRDSLEKEPVSHDPGKTLVSLYFLFWCS